MKIQELLKKCLILITLFVFFTCDDTPNNIPPPEKHERTVIIYMAADNDLDKYSRDGIEQLVNSQLRDEDNLIVYLDSRNKVPQLLKIKKEGAEVVKTYEEQNSADPLVLNLVLTDILDAYPSDSYGLVLWSHGTSWLPPQDMTKSFGFDNFKEMHIADLATALPLKFEYIIFDACFMGSIEVMYELKDKAKYLISSPAEVLAIGFPYKDIAPYLFKSDEASLIKIAETYYNYYNNLSGQYQSATISLVKTDHLNELAELNAKIVNDNRLTKWDYKQAQIQIFDQYTNHMTFDYYDFLVKNYPKEQLKDIETLLNKMVLYKAHTEYFLEVFKINTFSGIACYVPSKSYESFHHYYTSLKWASKSNWNLLL